MPDTIEPAGPRRRLARERGYLAVEPAGPLRGEVTAPPSKSVTNRLLVMAALAEGTSRLSSPLHSDDTVAMAGGLRALGVDVELLAEAAFVTGRGRHLVPTGEVVRAGLSGTTLRFLAALCLVARGEVVLDGEPGLRRRPLGPLLETLEAAGAVVRSEGGHPPLRISSPGLEGGHLVVDAAQSSQFATALLLVAPAAEGDLELEVANLGAAGYVGLTLELMRERGALVEERPGGLFVVSAAHRYRAGPAEVEYDASAAAHLLSLAVASGGSLTVTNARPTLQPDAAITRHFAALGAVVDRGPGGVTVSAGFPLRPLEADLSELPDQLPTLAVLAALAEGTSHLSGLAVSRGHETDRPSAVATELAKLGAEVSLVDDRLVIHGGRPLRGGVVETYGDHRMAMAFTALGAVVPGITIADPGCVAKTYPGWWEDVSALGVGLH